MSVNFKPLADRVLVEPIAAETKNCFRNHYPGHCKKKKPQEGTVVAVGNGKKRRAVNCKKLEIKYFMENTLVLN